MFVDIINKDLEIEIWEALDSVTDPELDEPITEMGFVELVEVTNAKSVRVEFRLPTYWCSPNFAFLMAIGIKQAVVALRWVHDVTVHLNDHCFDNKVNEGVNSGRAYSDVFSEYCDGADLDEVTRKFDGKAFEKRQEAVLLALRESGLSDRGIVSMTLQDLLSCEFEGEAAQQAPRYLDLLRSSGLAAQNTDRAFVTWAGQPVAPEALGEHLGRLRSTRINMEFNGALCRGLAKTRYKEVEIGPEGPSLVHFLAGVVPAAKPASPQG